LGEGAGFGGLAWAVGQGAVKVRGSSLAAPASAAVCHVPVQHNHVHLVIEDA
jgi:hypothetical protein